MDYEKNGVIKSFSLDMDEVLRREAENPEFSVIDVADGFDNKMRFTQLYLMAKLVGSDYHVMVHEYGYEVDDLVNIYVECIKEEGFRSAMQGEA